MLIIPAIDLKEGRCVRLRQGDMNQATVFSEAPAEVALKWAEAGASWLHIVDLDGAFDAKPRNMMVVRAILTALADHPNPPRVQLGGGLRDFAVIEQYLDMGVSKVVLGTAAVTNPGFLQEACLLFGEDIRVGLDAKDGKVAVDGWSKLTKHEITDLAKKYEDYGVGAIVYTDIGRDGMLSGINVEATVALAQAVSIPIIASGGVHTLKDIEALLQHESIGIAGVICGRALYEGTLDFAAARALGEGRA